jgi:hypothetical protein
MIFAALASLGLVLAAQDADPVVIKVEDTAITLSDLRGRLRDARERGPQLDAKKFADFVVAETVLAVDARGRKLDADPAVAAKLARERTKALAAATTELRLAAGVKPTEAELKNLFHLSRDTVRVKLIVVIGREEAQGILDRLRAGGDFAAESQRTLDPGARERKGDAGYLTRGDMDAALAKAAFSAPLGTLVGPIEMKMGWAVASFTERAIADEAGFEAQRASLETYLKTRTVYAAKAHYLESRRKQLKVTFDEKFLAGLGARVDMTPAEAQHAVATLDGKPILYRDVQSIVRSLAGGAAGSHTSGPKMKKRVIDEYIDELILADVAVAEKLDRLPSVAQAVARAQSLALAVAAAQAIAAKAKPGDQQAAIDRRVVELRKSLRVWVDEAAVARVVAEKP